jgi:hypothetical protein
MREGRRVRQCGRAQESTCMTDCLEEFDRKENKERKSKEDEGTEKPVCSGGHLKRLFNMGQ